MPAGRRLVQKMSSTRTFAKVAPHVIPAMDRAVHRLTRGKVLLSAQMLPGVILTARGARSGQPRVTPLACMPEGTAAGCSSAPTSAGRATRPGRRTCSPIRTWRSTGGARTYPYGRSCSRARSGRRPGGRRWSSGRRTPRTRRGSSARSGSSGSRGDDAEAVLTRRRAGYVLTRR